MSHATKLRLFLLPTAAALALSLAACASQPKPETGSVLPPQQMQCNAEAASAAIGQSSSDVVVEKARTDSGAKTTRVLKPGQPATLDFRHDRLNIRLDDKGVVKSLDCG